MAKKKQYMQSYPTKEAAINALEQYSKGMKSFGFIGSGLTLTVEKYKGQWWIIAIDRR